MSGDHGALQCSVYECSVYECFCSNFGLKPSGGAALCTMADEQRPRSEDSSTSSCLERWDAAVAWRADDPWRAKGKGRGVVSAWALRKLKMETAEVRQGEDEAERQSEVKGESEGEAEVTGKGKKGKSGKSTVSGKGQTAAVMA